MARRKRRGDGSLSRVRVLREGVVGAAGMDERTKRQRHTQSGNSVGIMQNSICNLNVFILRYAGAIFIFTENEGFTSAKSKDNESERTLFCTAG